jgi:hypothetical protein
VIGDGEKSTVDALADAGLEALATTWPVAETDEEMDAIVDGATGGGDQ